MRQDPAFFCRLGPWLVSPISGTEVPRSFLQIFQGDRRYIGAPAVMIRSYKNDESKPRNVLGYPDLLKNYRDILPDHTRMPTAPRWSDLAANQPISDFPHTRVDETLSKYTARRMGSSAVPAWSYFHRRGTWLFRYHPDPISVACRGTVDSVCHLGLPTVSVQFADRPWLPSLTSSGAHQRLCQGTARRYCSRVFLSICCVFEISRDQTRIMEQTQS